MYTVEMGSGGMIYIPNLMKLGTGIQAIIRFCIRHLRSYTIGITDGRDL
jgi:hypothetical protein